MILKQQYENRKSILLKNKSICKENRKWIKQVLEFFEKKGKRQNGIPVLDESCYKTLLGYTTKLNNVVKWYPKPIKKIKENEFKIIYEGLEEGEKGFCKSNGKIYEERNDYYTKIFKGKPFELIGKDKMVRKIIQYNIKKDKEVRFIPNFKQALKDLVQNAISPSHKLLIRILGDYGENIFSILQLTKKDFERIIDKETGEIYYLLNLHKKILKRSRTPRREYNLFPETREMLDKYLENLKSDDKLFQFGTRQAEKFFKRAVEKSGVKLQNGLIPVLKDLRSSMACFLLNEDWTSDEIKSRLGHRISSNVLDVYVSYLALDKNKTKKKHYQGNLKQLQEELESYKEKSKRDLERIEDYKKEVDEIKEKMKEIETLILKKK